MNALPRGFDAHVHTFPPTPDDVWEVERALQPWLAPMRRARRRAIVAEMRANPELAAPFTLGIGEAGVAWTSATGGSQLPWSRVGAVERRADDVLLRLTRPRGVARLPRRVASPDAIDRFAEAAERWARERTGPVERPVPPGFDAHQLRFRSASADIEAFLALMAGDDPGAFGSARPSWITLAIGVLAIVLSVRAFATGGGGWAAASLVLGGLLIAVALVPAGLPGFNRWLVRRHWRKAQPVQAETVLALGPAGVLQTDADGLHVTPWSAVTRIVETPEHTFLFVVRGGVLIVPSRAIADRVALADLRRDARAWQAAAPRPMAPRPDVPLAAPREPGDPFEPPASA